MSSFPSSVQVIQSEGLIYMVLEYGDIDLARLLAKHEKARREDGAEDLDENFIRLYWQQMLQALSLHFITTSVSKSKLLCPCCSMCPFWDISSSKAVVLQAAFCRLSM